MSFVVSSLQFTATSWWNDIVQCSSKLFITSLNRVKEYSRIRAQKHKSWLAILFKFNAPNRCCSKCQRFHGFWSVSSNIAFVKRYISPIVSDCHKLSWLRNTQCCRLLQTDFYTPQTCWSIFIDFWQVPHFKFWYWNRIFHLKSDRNQQIILQGNFAMNDFAVMSFENWVFEIFLEQMNNPIWITNHNQIIAKCWACDFGFSAWNLRAIN